MNPFRRKRPNPKRDEPRRVIGRERLHGKVAKEQRRREIFERSGGRCEVIKEDGSRCSNEITWTTMHWSHNRHAANKDDSMAGGLASCKQCHQVDRHNGGKPCNRRPGRVMNLTEARAYWQGETCFCNERKKSQESFCAACTLKLSPQVKLDLENTDSARDYCAALAAAELELLT